MTSTFGQVASNSVFSIKDPSEGNERIQDTGETFNLVTFSMSQPQP